MSTLPSTTTLAHVIGIESIAPAIVFAILYVPLLAWFVLQSIKRPTYVYVVLALFCSIRIAAFVIRAVLTTDSVGNNLGVIIADQILFGVGFFGLLYSAYTLVLDRELLHDVPPRKGPLAQILYNRRLFRLIMTAAVVLGIVGATQSTSAVLNKGNSLRIAGTVIFLVLTVLVAFQTFVLARIELQSERYRPTSYSTTRGDHGPGTKYGAYILCVIALLLLVREVFATATIGNLRKQNNEHLWYPLYALPEILAVAFYATPGLVPPRSELPQYQTFTRAPEAYRPRP